MKKLLVLFMVLAMANMAHGYIFGFVESAPSVDLGATTQYTIDITVTQTADNPPGPPPIDLDTVTALGLGASIPGVVEVVSYTNHVTGWGPWHMPPPSGYLLGVPDSGGGANYDSQWVMDGYDLGGFGGLFTGTVIGTMVLEASSPVEGGDWVTIDIFAADAASSDFAVYESPPATAGSGYIHIPEPGMTMLMLVAGMLGLIRRR